MVCFCATSTVHYNVLGTDAVATAAFIKPLDNRVVPYDKVAHGMGSGLNLHNNTPLMMSTLSLRCFTSSQVSDDSNLWQALYC